MSVWRREMWFFWLLFKINGWFFFCGDSQEQWTSCIWFTWFVSLSVRLHINLYYTRLHFNIKISWFCLIGNLIFFSFFVFGYNYWYILHKIANGFASIHTNAQEARVTIENLLKSTIFTRILSCRMSIFCLSYSRSF